MVAREKYYAEVGDNAFSFSGSKKTYEALKTTLGVKLVSSRPSSATGSPRKGVETKRVLPKIRLVLKKTATKKARRIDVYCDPDRVEDALQNLVRKSVDGQRVEQAYIPLRRCYV